MTFPSEPSPALSTHAARDAALAAAHAAYRERHPLSHAQWLTASRVMPAGNSRSTLFYPPYPLSMVKGEGARLWDMDGRCYTDFISEYTAGVYGHSPQPIRDAVAAALADGLGLCSHHPREVRLAQVIAARLPSMQHLRFTNSGTEANLMAITAARHFTGRPKVAVFEGAYHGGVLTFGQAPSAATAPYDFLVLPYNDTEAALAGLRVHAAEVAAVLVEPMLGAGGCIPARADFLAALREWTQATGALLIFDEVMTSRLAGHGLQGRLGIAPDLTTVGKYMGGGMPFGAFGGREDVMAVFDPRHGALAHSGTFNNNVVTMAAGHAGLTELFTPAAADALAVRGDALRQRLNARCAEQGVALQFTGLGSAMNAHFVAGPVHDIHAIAGVDTCLRGLLFHALLDSGFYIAARGLIALSMPLQDSDLDAFSDAVAAFVDRYRSVLPAA